jgi:O-antigen/teichoic acid export membrane protein
MIHTAFSFNFEFFYQSFYTLFEELFKLVFTVVMFYVFNLNAQGVILARVLAEFVSVLVMIPVFLKVYAPFRSVTVEKKLPFFQLLKAHGKWGMFAKYFDSFGKNARIWIIKLMLGTEAVGLFAVADGLFGHTASLVPIGKIVNPIIPQYIGNKERFFKLIDKSIKYQFIAFVAVIGIAFVTFPPIIARLFPNYVAAIPLYLSFLPILIPASFASIFTTMFYAYKAQASFFVAVVIKVIATLILTPLFIYTMGFYGIAVSYFLVTLIFVLERYRVLRKISEGFSMDIRDFFTMDEIDREILRGLNGKMKSLLRL